MLTLIIDTSETRILVILAENNRELLRLENTQMPLALLHTMIQNCVQSQKKTLSDLECVAVALGPGSWTGLNIGVTATKTLAQVLNIPLLPLTSFDAYAYDERLFLTEPACNCPAPASEDPHHTYIKSTKPETLYVCLDAKRSMLYTQQYEKDERGKLQQQGHMELLHIDALCERIRSENIQVLITGSGATLYKEHFEKECGSLADCMPHPERNLIQLAWERRDQAVQGLALFDIAPLYGQAATTAERGA